MDSVQRLRRQAEEAGTLQSSPQQTVTTQDQTITVEPANPNVVYVPVYDPTVVYGAWPYPDYPPYYFPPSGFVFGPPVWPGFWWGPVIDIGFVAPYWRWHHFDWDHHRIRIDRDRFYRIEGHHRPIVDDTWQHDQYHRRGVAYRDPARRHSSGDRSALRRMRMPIAAMRAAQGLRRFMNSGGRARPAVPVPRARSPIDCRRSSDRREPYSTDTGEDPISAPSRSVVMRTSR
jgi:hypothetical protein